MRRTIAACRRAACSNRTRIIASLAASLIWANHAFGANLALQVSSETAPAGGWAQIKVYAAPPALISSGRMAINFDPSVFGPIARVAVFSAAGDASGIAAVNGQSLDVNFGATSAGIGQLPDMPVLAVTVPVLANAAAGTVSAIVIDPTLSPWTDQNGNVYTVSATPGSVTVGGSLSIESLTPGGGLLSAGSQVRIQGTGFGASTTVNIAGVGLSSTQFVSPNEIEVTLEGAADLTGKLVTLSNPDGSETEFFSSIQSVPDVAPVDVEPVQPLLSSQTWTAATTLFFDRPFEWAIQNPNAVPLEVTVQMLSPGVSFDGQTTMTLPPGALQVCCSPGGEGGVNVFAALPFRISGIEFLAYGPNNPPPAVAEPVYPVVPPLQQVTPSPSAVSFSWQEGRPVPAPVNVVLIPYGGALAAIFTYTVDWSEGPFTVTSGTGSLTVAVNPARLGPGIYIGSISITPEGPNAAVTTIPLSLTVSASVLLAVSPPSLQFFGSPQTPQPATVSVTSNGNPTSFTVTASNGSGPNWLSVSSTGGTTPGQFTVTANSTNLPNGVYNGQIVIVGPNNTVAVPVQLTVGDSNMPSQPAVTFSVQTGSPPPPPQFITVDGPNQGWAFSASTNSGGNWLTFSVAQFGLTIMANPAGLAAGSYGGAVMLTSPYDPVPIQIPVTLVIWNQPPALMVNPASATFTIPFASPVGQQPSQTLQVTTNGAPLNFTASIYGGQIFTTPASISVSPQSDTTLGTVVQNVSFTSGSQTVVVPVTTVTTTSLATPPFLGSIVNAASQLPGSVSPGEILSIHGFGAGPPETAGFTLGPSGSVATSLNGAQVLFDGKPAPMIYGSAYQANVIVPYEVANQSITAISLEYGGVVSKAWAVPVAPSAPGLFTVQATGVGQAAVLNQDNTANGPSNPAARGTVIQIYATGEGQTTPAGVTGSIIGTNLKKPVLPVTVTIGGQNAAVQYAGSAPDSIAGLLQVNAVVPQSVAPGAAVPIGISVGGSPSQSGVTIAVQ